MDASVLYSMSVLLLESVFMFITEFESWTLYYFPVPDAITGEK
jgi:hypothetical protein